MTRPPCPHCGHKESTISGTGRLRCKACRKSYPINGKYVRPPEKPCEPEACPKCGAIGSPARGGSINGRKKGKCKSCAHTWNLGARVVSGPSEEFDHITPPAARH